MIDRFGREITYLRVSVTDRCNLRCTYCMDEGGVALLGHDDILSFEEITDVVGAAVEMGVTKVRLTGGDPLVRRGIVELVRMVADIDGIADLAMTTNGLLLAPMAAELKVAGLMRVNVSLDAIDPERFAAITRGGRVSAVLAGIDAAVDAGLTPVKLNCVIDESADEPDARDVAEFARPKHLAVRFIRRMDLAAGSFSVVEGGEGGNCPACNRLRLTSDGLIRPCLFADIGYSVRELGPREAIRRALGAKPAAGHVSAGGQMRRIGG
jgi:cyclic pyranopterin phosphate synthase